MYSTAKETIRARNMADNQAQVFMANDKLLFPILKTLTLFPGSLQATGYARCFSLCVVAVLYTDRIHPLIVIIKLR